jgi:hypothetical protein
MDKCGRVPLCESQVAKKRGPYKPRPEERITHRDIGASPDAIFGTHRYRPAVRALLPSLRRPYGHHRDLRSRPPAMSPASDACGGNPDRYLMSVDTSHTTALSALVVDRHRCCSAQCVDSTAFQMARSAETQRQRRSFTPGDPIRSHNHNILAP